MMKLNLKPSSVFLVSGGARGITAQCVIKLAQYCPCKWILLGRSAYFDTEPDWATGCYDEPELKQRILQHLMAQGNKPSPLEIQKIYKELSARREIENTLQILRQLGSQVEYLKGDVTDHARLQAQLSSPTIERLGPITGIIHGAGSLADKRIEKKTEQDYDRVYQPKVQGLANLLSCVPAEQLEYLVLFSSVAGFYGNAGQTDYALANEILNKAAYLVKHHHPQCHVVAINWGPWEGGMVTPALRKVFEDRQVEIIPIKVGTEILAREMAVSYRDRPTQIVVGSPLPLPVCELDNQLHTHRIRRQLTLTANPFLQDHIVGGSPVLPFTCTLSWLFTSADQLYPGYQTFLIENVRVLKGIIFDSDLASEYVLDLQEITKTQETIELDAKIWSQSRSGSIRYNYRGKLTLLKTIDQPPYYDGLDFTPNSIGQKILPPYYQANAASLFHGPAFRGIETVINATPEKITVRCFVPSIDERQQGQFTVSKQSHNPYTADVQTHAVWLWLQYFHQSGCLPASIERFEKYAPAPYNQPFYTSTTIQAKTETSLTVNIVTHDDKGTVYSNLYGAQGTIFPLSALTLAQASA
ncbi:MAG: SDR family NAD(P)-dependent oxidoreductase [Cyanobacteria bacterium P01_D01_bin.44]